MGILTALLDERPYKASAVSATGAFGWSPMGGTEGGSEAGSLESSAVWRCVNLIAGGVASLPCILYRRLPDGQRQRANDHQLYGVLHDRPNPNLTAFAFWESALTWLLLRGNAYALIVPNTDGPVSQLVPLHPDRVTVEKVPTGRMLSGGIPEYQPRYKYRSSDGQSIALLADEVFHLRGLTLDGDGLKGVSVLEYARRSIELNRNTERYGAQFFSQGSTPRGVIQTKGQISTEAAQRLAADWQSLHGGIENAHRVAVLEEGAEWKPISIAPEDSQFLQTREFQIAEICRWFGIVAPWLVAAQEKQTSWGTGIEQTSIGHVTYTLLPWIRRIEAEIALHLVSQPKTYFAEFLVDNFTRGDLESRYRAYATARQWGWFSVNDIRRAENHNPIGAEGDIYLQPANMIAADEQHDLEDDLEDGVVDAGETQNEQTPPPPLGPPTPEPAPTDAAATAALAHYAALLEETAYRIVRREVTTLSKAGKRASTTGQGWAEAIETFYAEHGPYCAQAMRITPLAGAMYAAQRAALLRTGGLEALESSIDDAAAALVALGRTAGGIK